VQRRRHLWRRMNKHKNSDAGQISGAVTGLNFLAEEKYFGLVRIRPHNVQGLILNGWEFGWWWFSPLTPRSDKVVHVNGGNVVGSRPPGLDRFQKLSSVLGVTPLVYYLF